MGRIILKTILILGVVLGLGSGFAHLRHHRYGHGGCHHDRAARFEDHIAEVCAQAALRTRTEGEKTR